MFAKESKILAVGAHPDDVEIGCGGVLSWCHSGKAVTVCSRSEEPRVHEARLASEQMQVTPVILNHQKSKIDERQLVNEIESEINSFQPDMLFVHWKNDRHQDHRVVTTATLSAARAFRGMIFFYKSPSSLDFLPNVYFEMTDQIWEKKLSAIWKHATQLDKPYLSRRSLEYSYCHWPEAYRGTMKPCEPFHLYRSVFVM